MSSTLAVGALPGRKQPALYINTDGTIRVLAYFKSLADMEEFLTWEPQVTGPEEG